MAAVSPSSSPRLPSPPPIAEDQIGPTSPGVSLFEDHAKFPSNAIDTGASRRIRPGTKAEDMAEGPPLVELADIDSAFPLTEHLKAIHYAHTHPPNSHTTVPIDADTARQFARPPPNTSKEIWLYELARFLIQKTNAIIVALFSDSPPCSPQTCPEMRASEWQYLCAVHDPPKSCSAIDYCCHTLDWAANTLTSGKMFPSRLGLGGPTLHSGMQVDKVLQQQMKEITNIFRRVYRIYAHAWFQHRDMFWRVEGKTGLYVFFKCVCDEYGMIQAENYTIPPEAEGLEPEPSSASAEIGGPTSSIPSLLRREPSEAASQGVDRMRQAQEEQKAAGHGGQEAMGNTILAAGETTKRHRHTVSDRQSSVSSVSAVIQEEVEEEEAQEAEDAENAEEKPSLERQATSLKALDEGGEKEDEDAVESVLGTARADDVKPERQEEDNEAEGENVTVIEHGDADAESGGKEEAEIDAMDPSESAAGEGQEAGKSVGD